MARVATDSRIGQELDNPPPPITTPLDYFLKHQRVSKEMRRSQFDDLNLLGTTIFNLIRQFCLSVKILVEKLSFTAFWK